MKMKLNDHNNQLNCLKIEKDKEDTINFRSNNKKYL